MSDVTYKGPWHAREVARFLEGSGVPIRLACCGADGFPRVISLWYRYHEGQLICVTHRSAQLLSLLARDPRVGFEISPNEPPYHGVRGQGLAQIEELGAESALQDMLARYLGGTESSLARWLMSRSDEERLITITPSRFFSWDYRERMADAVSD